MPGVLRPGIIARLHGGVVAAATFFLQQESADKLLLESGDSLLTEDG